MKQCLFSLLLLSCRFFTAAGQATQTEFGKNVIQYKSFEWAYYQTENFDVYFYEGGREPARFLVEYGEKYLHEVEKMLDYQSGEKVNFIVYNSYSDFRQSNFHTSTDVYNIGGRTPLNGNKIFIYFNGDHFDFIRQIKAGFAKITLMDLMAGSSLQERVQNSVLLSLPEWFTEGMIRYISSGWNPYLDNQLKEGIVSERFHKFKRLADDEKLLVAQSLWKYIYDQYGEAAFSNILYNTRAARNLETGFEFVLGKNFSQVLEEWYHYNFTLFTSIKAENPASFEELKLGKMSRRGVITNWDVSGSGNKLAVVTNDQGKIKVWVQDIESHKTRCIFKTGYRRIGEMDYSYPVITWNPVQDVLTVFYEYKGLPYYFNYNANTRKKDEKQLISSVDYIRDASYSNNGRFIVASAIKNGQSDIFIFDPRTQFFRPLTNDIYDDRQPRFINNSKAVVFSSNRPNTGLNKVSTTSDYHFGQNYDIYCFPDYLARPQSIKRMSRGAGNESFPDYYDTSYVSYLSEDNGILNANAAYLDSIFQYTQVVAQYKDTSHHYDTLRFYKNNKTAIRINESILSDQDLLRIDTSYVYKDTVYTYNITDYTDNILSYHIHPRFRSDYQLFRMDGNYRLFRRPTPAGISSFRKQRPDHKSQSKNVGQQQSKLRDIVKIEITDNLPKDTVKKDTSIRYSVRPYFQTEFPEDTLSSFTGTSDTAVSERERAREAEKRAILFGKKDKKKNKFAAEALYFTTFSIDEIVTQIDNSVITSPYLPYQPGDRLIYSPTLNGVMKLGASDLFKDYRFIGGFGFRPDLRGAEYFLTFENLRKRLDKRFTFYRKGETQDVDGQNFSRVTSLEGRAELRWPFSEILSIRGSTFGRLDQTTYLSGDQASLTKEGLSTYWTGAKLELVFDNTINRGLNLRTGTRYKIYSEFFDALNKEKTSFAVVGGDFRTYTKISRQIIWANRISFASSMGSAKVVYFLGGADGWMFPKTNENTPSPKENYVYKLMPGSLRGFNENMRNGNTFGLINSELRVPLFRYIANRPIRSQFFENFQVVPFIDAGSAWLGLLPTGENNAYQTSYIYRGPITVSVTTQRDPMIYGYGVGFRSTILGYFLRLDYAWGVADGENVGQSTYFSMGLDF